MTAEGASAARTSFLTFATDLIDEGFEAVFDRAGSHAGVGGVTLASAYHDARDVFTHNPKRVVYFQEPGALFFKPTPERFDGLAIKPIMSSVVGGRDLVRELVLAAEERGQDANAWVVLLHADRGRDTEFASPRNAFGDPYLTQLCPANPDARAYAVAVVTDVAARGVRAILAEAFHFLPFEHGFHHERAFVDIAPITSFLLSLCFCDECTRAAREYGVDSDSLQAQVRDAIRRGLTEPTDPSVVEEEAAVRDLFGGELGAFLEVRSRTVTSLVGELVDAVRETNPDATLFPVDPSGAIKGYAGGRPTGVSASGISWKLGVDVGAVATASGALEVMGYAHDPARILDDLRAYRTLLPADSQLGVIVRPVKPDCDGAANLREKLDGLMSQSVERIDFYHYGLAPLASFDWLRDALQKRS